HALKSSLYLSLCWNGRLLELTAAATGIDLGAITPVVHSTTAFFGRAAFSFYLNRRLSRDSWLIDVQPISFMSRSISVRMRPSARSTPAWPAAAKGKR